MLKKAWSSYLASKQKPQGHIPKTCWKRKGEHKLMCMIIVNETSTINIIIIIYWAIPPELTFDCLFLSLWASSTTSTAQSIDCKVVMSIDTSSYDVNNTWNFTGWSFCEAKIKGPWLQKGLCHVMLSSKNLSIQFIISLSYWSTCTVIDQFCRQYSQ